MISVIMGVYNGEPFLESAIKSILNQTFNAFEFIIVNDGSTDNSLSICQRYANEDDRIKLIDLGRNVGRCHALNYGIEIAQYPWIAIMDADDIALPHRFKRQMKAIEEDPEVITWGSYISHINSTGKVLSVNKVGPSTHEEMNQRIQQGIPVFIMHPTALIRKDIVEQVGGYNQAFTPAEDIELFSRVIEHGPILAIPEVLLLYRIHGRSLSMTNMAVQQQYTNYVKLRYENRLTNTPMLTLEDYLEAQKKKSFLQRLRWQMQLTRSLYYRRAGMAYGEGKWIKALSYFAFSAIIDPRYAIPRVWQQLVSAPRRYNKNNTINPPHSSAS